jgi:D-alanine-D-alanine ligase-like ATP-grasp enzyme
LKMSKDICKALSIQENDIFTCDFAWWSKHKKPYLIEINSAPGIWFPEKDKKYRTKFYKDIAKHFQKLALSSI